jgi:hypothetical protein
MSLLLPGLLTGTVFIGVVSGIIAASVDTIGDAMMEAMDGISDMKFAASEKWDNLKRRLNRSVKRRKKIHIPLARNSE